jgi:hypothetical protein
MRKGGRERKKDEGKMVGGWRVGRSKLTPLPDANHPRRRPPSLAMVGVSYTYRKKKRNDVLE